MNSKIGLYGSIPVDIERIPAHSIQYSPLIPGSSSLETAHALSSFFLLAPPGTIERNYVLVQALHALAPEGELIAMAPKDKGGSRILKELEFMGCIVNEDSKRHHRICRCKRPSQILNFETVINEGSLRFDPALSLWTQPGVFSWNRLDPGTQLLLENLPSLAGKGLDLGAGLGILSKEILLKNKTVEHMTLIELDRRAHEASKKNLTERFTAFWADAKYFDFENTLFDFVVMNPPFHDGGVEDQALGKKFIEKAAAALKSGKKAYIVANKHLPYEAAIAEYFSESKILASTNAFKVVEARR